MKALTKFMHRHDNETEVEKTRRGLHLQYHIKNICRVGVLCVAYWVVLVMGGLYVVPHLVGYMAGMLRITYESKALDIVIWGFCSFYAVMLCIIGSWYVLRWLTKAWNGLFINTIAEGQALKRLKAEKEEDAQKKFMERFGLADFETTDSVHKAGKRKK